MDWFSWLRKTQLDPTLSYEYGQAFARNMLERQDLPYFDHEFLLSMGITVAKHRLEILKLAKSETGSDKSYHNKKFWKFFSRTRKSVTRRLNKWVFQGEPAVAEPFKEENPPQTVAGWRIDPCVGGTASVTGKMEDDKEHVGNRLPVIRTKRISKSGPLDGKTMQENTVHCNRSPKPSGPSDRAVQEGQVLAYRSPLLSGPLNGGPNQRLKFSERLNCRTPSPRVYKDNKSYGHKDQNLWGVMFRDMKPT